MELLLPTDGIVVFWDVLCHCMHAAMQDWLLCELMEGSWLTDGIVAFDAGEGHCDHTALHDSLLSDLMELSLSTDGIVGFEDGFRHLALFRPSSILIGIIV